MDGHQIAARLPRCRYYFGPLAVLSKKPRSPTYFKNLHGVEQVLPAQPALMSHLLRRLWRQSHPAYRKVHYPWLQRFG